MDESTFYRLQPGDIVTHNLTPWKQFIVVCVKERKPGTRKPIFWICEISEGIPATHVMGTPNEWKLVSLVMHREGILNDQETKEGT